MGIVSRLDALRQTLNVLVGGVLDTGTTYNYDGNQQITSIKQTGSGSGAGDKYAAFTYRSDGQFDTIKRYEDQQATASKLVSTTTYGYNGRSELTSLTHVLHNAASVTYGYTYDSDGRIQTLTTAAEGTLTYGYDERDQLKTADFTNTALADQSFDFDDNGNRTDGENTPGSFNRQFDDNDYTYQYDAAGNTIRRDAKAGGDYDVFIWDARNRLTLLEHKAVNNTLLWTVAYQYDYLNRLVGRTETPAGGTAVSESYVYDGNQMILRLDGSGAVEDRYLWGAAVDQLLADDQATSSGDNTLWTLGDHQNSVRDLVDFDPSTTTASVVSPIRQGNSRVGLELSNNHFVSDDDRKLTTCFRSRGMPSRQ